MNFPILPLVLAVVALLLLLKTFLIVKEASAAVIERFGKFQSVRTSGLSLLIPFIDNNTLVNSTPRELISIII